MRYISNRISICWAAMCREDQINEFRNRLHISVMGGDIPNPITSFDQMAFTPDQAQLKQTVLHNIEGFGSSTHIL